MNYKIFLISRRGQGAGIRCQGSGVSPRLTYSAITDNPEGGQAVRVSIYEKDCSNEKYGLNLICSFVDCPRTPEGGQAGKVIVNQLKGYPKSFCV